MNAKEFDMSYWKNRSMTLILSDNDDQESEKLCNNLIKQYNIICPLNDVRIVLSPNNNYNDHMTKQYCYGRYDTAALRSVIKRQEAMIYYGKERKTDYGANVLLVIDDSNLSCDIMSSDENLKYIMSNNRFLNITTIIRMPYEILDDSHRKILQNNNSFQSICNNVDYIFMFPSQNQELKRCELYQQFSNNMEHTIFEDECIKNRTLYFHRK